MDPKFRDIFRWLSPYTFNCCLKHKRSTSSHTTDRSPSSVEGSDSVYSSFEDSSIMSVPNLLEESSRSDDEEKDFVPFSISYSDISDPVSPLQKTLSTWQTLENWLKKKQDLILKPDPAHVKRYSCVSKANSVELEERYSLNPSDVVDGSSYALQFSTSSLSEHADCGERETVLLSCENLELNKEMLDLSFHFPYLPVYFYFFGWFIMLCNVAATFVYILIQTAQFSVSYSILFFKSILISVVFSCLAITPVVILVIAITHSVNFSIRNRKQHFPATVEQLSKEKKLPKVDYNASIYHRIEYFRKYLRPPKEQILKHFRNIAMQEKRICNFYSDVWKHVVVLIFLLAVTLPGDLQMKYLQRESIQKSLFRSVQQTTKYLPSKHLLLSWLETDFLDGFLSEHQCVDTDEECGMMTKCFVVGSIVMRHFYTPYCLSSNLCRLSVNDSYDEVTISGDIYERRSLKGYYGTYFVEDEWQVLSDKNFYTYDELHIFVEKLNASSAASLEFLLLNPTFSTFISVSVLFEMMRTGVIAISHEILPITIPGGNDPHYFRIFFNSIFFIFILFSLKNQLWKMLKHKLLYWRQAWNIFSLLFILVYVIYLTSFVLFIATYDSVALRLIGTQLHSNINVTKVVAFETCVHVSSGILVFMHILQSFKVLIFNHRLKKVFKILIGSIKNISAILIFCFVFILASSTLVKHFIGITSSFSHPLFGFVKVFDSFLKDYGKPEVTDTDSMVKNVFAVFISLMLVFTHLYLFSIIRSVLLNYKCADGGMKKQSLTLKDTSHVLKKKLLSCFDSTSPQVISHEDYIPPVDFLLFELEKLADALLAKAENLFPEKSDEMYNIESFLESQCKLPLDRSLKFSEVELLNASMFKGEAFNVELKDKVVGKAQERLTSTIPRLNRVKHNLFLPSSFHTSLGSESKFRTLDSSSVLQQNRIRKTYPLYHLDSTSTTSSGQDEELEDPVNNSLIRKTKSRGKGKTENFDLNVAILDCDTE